EEEPPVFAVDVSVWPRCDAECSPQRGYYYHPSRHSAGSPIVAGWAYQFVARLTMRPGGREVVVGCSEEVPVAGVAGSGG
ncbi:MAG: hypothetical protein LC751_01330, partial [Actinobacteria bacterium]|nr:hypothetical protein [Actinomycetota bacterium]